MTYCVEETKLLARAGREMAKGLLPEPFSLQFSDHDTGCQMTILAKGLPVWKGSIWYSNRYEFNDSENIPGLQPEFDFARPVIEKYFADVRIAVDVRDRQMDALRAARAAEVAAQKRSAIESVRQQLSAHHQGETPDAG